MLKYLDSHMWIVHISFLENKYLLNLFYYSHQLSTNFLCSVVQLDIITHISLLISTLSLLYIVFHHFGYSPLWLQMAIGIATPVFPTQMVYHVREKIWWSGVVISSQFFVCILIFFAHCLSFCCQGWIPKIVCCVLLLRLNLEVCLLECHHWSHVRGPKD